MLPSVSPMWKRRGAKSRLVEDCWFRLVALRLELASESFGAGGGRVASVEMQIPRPAVRVLIQYMWAGTQEFTLPASFLVDAVSVRISS